MTVPVAYVRRSARASKASDGEISLAAQESAIRELAKRDGYNGELVIFTDAGRSGDEAKLGQGRHRLLARAPPGALRSRRHGR